MKEWAFLYVEGPKEAGVTDSRDTKAEQEGYVGEDGREGCWDNERHICRTSPKICPTTRAYRE